jgi:hypothetical protein
MRRPGLRPLRGWIWAAVIIALLSFGRIAKPLRWAEACGDAGSSGLASSLRTPRPSAVDGPEYVEPWGLSPTGEHLGPGFRLEDHGLPLLR